MDVEQAVEWLQRASETTTSRHGWELEEGLEELHAGFADFVVTVGEEGTNILEEVVEVELNDVLVGADHFFETVDGV